MKQTGSEVAVRDLVENSSTHETYDRADKPVPEILGAPPSKITSLHKTVHHVLS